MRILRRLLIAIVALGLLGVLAWSLLLAPAINREAAALIAQAGLQGATVEIHPDGATLAIPSLPEQAIAAGLGGSGLQITVSGIGADDLGALVDGINGGTVTTLPEGISYDLGGDEFILPVVGGELVLYDFVIEGDGVTGRLSASLGPDFGGAARAAISEVEGGLQIALADGSLIRLDGGTLTESDGDWLLAGDLGIEALLALAR